MTGCAGIALPPSCALPATCAFPLLRILPYGTTLAWVSSVACSFISNPPSFPSGRDVGSYTTGVLGAAVILSFAVSFRNGPDRRGLVNMSASISVPGTCFSSKWPLRELWDRKWCRRSINLRRLVGPVFGATRMVDWMYMKKGVGGLVFGCLGGCGAARWFVGLRRWRLCILPRMWRVP